MIRVINSPRPKTTREFMKALGIDKMSDSNWILTKMGEINANRNGIPPSGDLIVGRVGIVDDGNNLWFVIENLLGWYKTSPIKSFRKIKYGYEFETQNSIYIFTKEIK